MKSGFNPDIFQKLFVLESNNFWFCVRNQIIIWSIKKYAGHLDSFLEIGCGTGFVTQAIADAFPSVDITGSEYFHEGLLFAQKRLPQVNFIQLDACALPYKNKFAAIGAFDVLEHIKKDDIALQKMYQSIKAGGFLFITVPQHAWLWSAFDEISYHERRYSAKELHDKIQAAGFRILRSSSYVTSLLPFMFLNRICRKNKSNHDDSVLTELKINPIINSLFKLLLMIDAVFIKMGCNLRWGGSRLVVARKV